MSVITVEKNTNSSTIDKTPNYTVKDVAEMFNLTKHAIRYYDNENLIPSSSRTKSNIRLFSDYDLGWIKIINCLRYSGLPIKKIKEYVDMCLEGDITIPERAKIICQQEKELEKQLEEVSKQLDYIRFKKKYYEDLIATGCTDKCNPAK